MLSSYDDDDRVLIARDADDMVFIILVKIRLDTYVALTSYEDPGIASQEFYITDSPIHQEIAIERMPLQDMCLKIIEWAVRIKHTLRRTDDYDMISYDDGRQHPFLRTIYDNYFSDLNTVIIIATQMIVETPNYFA